MESMRLELREMIPAESAAAAKTRELQEQAVSWHLSCQARPYSIFSSSLASFSFSNLFQRS